jgi:predicted membrane-bound dolichyl-phosphate-mannose-protein mannosyltransferase
VKKRQRIKQKVNVLKNVFQQNKYCVIFASLYKEQAKEFPVKITGISRTIGKRYLHNVSSESIAQ